MDSITYEARFSRQTKNYLVYEFSGNGENRPFQLYVPKADLPTSPAKLKMTLEEA